MKIAFVNDHGAVEMRDSLLPFMRDVLTEIEVLDFGTETADSVDYPDMAEKAIRAVLEDRADLAILACGTGIGMSIVANKFPGIRCALCTDEYSAQMARTHNNANALALRGRNMDPEKNCQILRTFLQAEFEGGRHQRRIDKITRIEEKNSRVT